MIEAAQSHDAIDSPADNRFPIGDAGIYYYYSIVSVQRSKIDGGRLQFHIIATCFGGPGSLADPYNCHLFRWPWRLRNIK